MSKKITENSHSSSGSNGYLKKCDHCSETIRMQRDQHDGKWRPFESWSAGNARDGEWILHSCA